MSGGSFNYLCHKELEDLIYNFGEDWDNMLSELDTLCPEAATEMRKIRTSTEEFVKEHEARWDRLQPLLHAIEWWRSCDWSFGNVEEAINDYRKSSTTA